MSEDDYKCPICGQSGYTHEWLLARGFVDIRIYICNGRLVWWAQGFDPVIYVPQNEVIDLQARYESLLLETTAFLDSLIDPVESFVAVLAEDFEEDDFYEDEDPEEIQAAWLRGEKGNTAMGEKVKNYFVGTSPLHEDEVDSLPGKES